MLRDFQVSVSCGEVHPGGTEQLVKASRKLRAAADQLKFAEPVSHVYNPLAYAREAHESYLLSYGHGPKRIVFLGMNPGPFGMVQTGIPFGEIAAVRDWLKIQAPIQKPPREHPQRPIEGFACKRSEISGQRLWFLFGERFGSAENFFQDHFVVNYCPLAFLETSGRNRTPDKLPAEERSALFAACDEHLLSVARVLRPEWWIGIGDFASKRLTQLFSKSEYKLGRILHPSPASPAANRDWLATATRQLIELGVWG